jgi:hypothetical protein
MQFNNKVEEILKENELPKIRKRRTSDLKKLEGLVYEDYFCIRLDFDINGSQFRPRFLDTSAKTIKDACISLNISSSLVPAVKEDLKTKPYATVTLNGNIFFVSKDPYLLINGVQQELNEAKGWVEYYKGGYFENELMKNEGKFKREYLRMKEIHKQNLLQNMGGYDDPENTTDAL